MKQMFTILLMVIAVGITSGSAFGAADTKLGTVDLQRALMEVKAGKAARSKLEKFVSNKKSEIEKEERAIMKAKESFEKQALVMNEKTRLKKQQELQARFMKLQEKKYVSQQELQKQEMELTQPLIEQLQKVVQKLAKKRGYTMVLGKNLNTVLFSLDKDDLTEDVIKAFNKRK